jgi:hypothetical protein
VLKLLRARGARERLAYEVAAPAPVFLPKVRDVMRDALARLARREPGALAYPRVTALNREVSSQWETSMSFSSASMDIVRPAA